MKICLVVNDEAKCYSRLSTTMEWDTAAADAIAGGGGAEK
ncbi:inositol monophosphatase family protein [Campylobacter jejuni]|nr:inositol monophosphatase family protein [Campylobacter jejuni]